MQITLSSFGFSHGAMEADYVFDLRFLPNPFWVAELKPYPGILSDLLMSFCFVHLIPILFSLGHQVFLYFLGFSLDRKSVV